MTTKFADWLDARDGPTLARAWEALGATRVEVGAPGWTISPHGAAQLAAAFLGWPIERVAWIGGPVDDMPAPSFRVDRTVMHSFLEHGIDVREECYETWTMRELRDGERGLQHVVVDFFTDDGTRDGGSGFKETAVRVFDRATCTGASIFIAARTVATIGEVDVTALDLFDRHHPFQLATWNRFDPDGVRGLLALVAAEVDAHFDVSATWLSSRAWRLAPNDTLVLQRFESGAFAITFRTCPREAEDGTLTGWVDAEVHGLPWGHRLYVYVDHSERGTWGHLMLRLPLVTGQAVTGRLAAIPGLISQ